MLKQMPAAKLTAFLTSMVFAEQAGAEKMSFASQSLENLHIADWTDSRGPLVKILKQTLETALLSKESARSNDETIRKRKSWNKSETADQLENPKVSIDEMFISRYRRVFPCGT